MCPKCLIDQMAMLLAVYIAEDLESGKGWPREKRARELIQEAKAMSHSHDDMVPIEEAEEASRT